MDADAAIELGVTLLFGAAPLLILAIVLAIWGHPAAVLALGVGDLGLIAAAVASVVALVGIGKVVEGMPVKANAEDVLLLGGIAAVGLLSAAFGGYTAAWVHVVVRDMPAGAAIAVYVLGLVVAYVGFGLLGTIYRGEIHKIAALPSALVGYAVFAAWASGGRAVFGPLLALLGVA